MSTNGHKPGRFIRAPSADLDERDPDYIRETLPRLWLLSSLYFRGEVRGLGPMLALELVEDGATKAPATELTGRVTHAALKRGLILLSCGLYGNVIRLLPPLNISVDELDEGLAILEDALSAV